MQPLRSARVLARLVLAWFVLALGAAVAAPVVQPHAAQLVCAGGGLKLLHGDGEGDARLGMALDCPLCSTAGAPPPVAPGVALSVARHGVAAAPALRVPSARALALPPARGPPARATS